MLSKLRNITDEIYFLFAVSAFCGAYIGIPLKMVDSNGDMGGSDPFNMAAMAMILLGLIVLGARDWRQLLVIARHAQLINLFMLFAALSAIWSLEPSITLRRTVTLATTIGFAYYAVSRFSMDGIIRRIALVCLLSAITSAAVAIAIPSVGIMIGGVLTGDWSGVFVHKQQLGWAMYIGSLSFGWLLMHEKGWRRLAYIGGMMICVVLLVLANSQTAILSTVSLPLVAAITRIPRLSRVGRMWAVFIAALAMIAIAITTTFYVDTLMGMIDRDVTLTGRVPLWELLLASTSDHLLTGYGYGAFWLDQNPIASRIIAVSGWIVPEAHNSYIDLMINLGIPGLLIAVIVLFGTIRRAFADVADGVPWATFAASYTVILLVTSIVETMLFRPGDIQCMLVPLLYVALRLHRAGTISVAHEVEAFRAGQTELRPVKPGLAFPA